MPKLIFDIETIGEDFDAIDKTTQESLTYWIDRESSSKEEYEATLEDVKNRLGFSPLTGEIVVIGVLDYERDKSVVYFQAPDVDVKEFEEENVTFKPMTEKEMLEHFWQGVTEYDEFISFNGRPFDVPFLMTRSAVHRIRPTKNLMSHRYIGSQWEGAKHIDLLDLLSFQGAMRKRGNLHLWSRAFGIKSPKEDGVTGDDVGKLFADKKYVEIAKYNVRDLQATKALYEYWDKYLRF